MLYVNLLIHFEATVKSFKSLFNVAICCKMNFHKTLRNISSFGFCLETFHRWSFRCYLMNQLLCNDCTTWKFPGLRIILDASIHLRKGCHRQPTIIAHIRSSDTHSSRHKIDFHWKSSLDITCKAWRFELIILPLALRLLRAIDEHLILDDVLEHFAVEIVTNIFIDKQTPNDL